MVASFGGNFSVTNAQFMTMQLEILEGPNGMASDDVTSWSASFCEQHESFVIERQHIVATSLLHKTPMLLHASTEPSSAARIQQSSPLNFVFWGAVIPLDECHAQLTECVVVVFRRSCLSPAKLLFKRLLWFSAK